MSYCVFSNNCLLPETFLQILPVNSNNTLGILKRCL